MDETDARHTQSAQPVPPPPAQATYESAFDAASGLPERELTRDAASVQAPSEASRPAAPADRAPAKRKWVVPVVIAAVILVLFALCAAACVSLLGRNVESYAPNTVAVITLDGTIGYDGSANSPEGLSELLDKAGSNDNIVAVVLRVNSGGGTAAAGEEMSRYLADFDKPVVVSSAAINASAAYMISAQADYIYVLESTDIGSIGTLLQHYDLSELYEKLGVNIETIKSADGKDSSYSNRPLTDEERERYQRLIDAINEVFVNLVAQGRDMDVEEVRALADGMSWVGTEAVELGIADEVGTYDDACAKAAELAGCGEDYEVTDLGKYNADITTLLGVFGSNEETPEEQLARLLEEMSQSNGSIR